MKILDVPQSGSRGKVVASRNRFGPFQCERVPRNQPGTAAQHGMWGVMKRLSRLWNELAEEQREAWRRLAEKVHSRPKLGQSGPLDGCQLFKKLNSVLATCGRELLLDPPPLPQFGPNPVIGFEARRDAGKLVFKLQVTRRARWEARSPLEDLMVFGWTPCNAGAAKNSLYAFLGLVSAPVEWESDITAMYLAKLKQWRKLTDKRYHLPLEGSRVFIRVWQQVNGWENKLGLFQASALVPANEAGVAGEGPAGRRK